MRIYFEITNLRNEYTLKSYSFIDLIGEVGGLSSAVAIIAAYFFSVYNYSIHEMIVYEKFKDSFGKEEMKFGKQCGNHNFSNYEKLNQISNVRFKIWVYDTIDGWKKFFSRIIDSRKDIQAVASEQISKSFQLDNKHYLGDDDGSYSEENGE